MALAYGPLHATAGSNPSFFFQIHEWMSGCMVVPIGDKMDEHVQFHLSEDRSEISITNGNRAPLRMYRVNEFASDASLSQFTDSGKEARTPRP